jgi:hypothetical protein
VTSQRGRANGVSNGLSGERKFRFFEELIEEDDELPHDGGQRDFLGFSGGDEALVKRLEYRIKPSRDGSGHVEHPADFDPSAADRSSASVHATVPIIRCHSGQCTSFVARERSEFRHLRE